MVCLLTTLDFCPLLHVTLISLLLMVNMACYITVVTQLNSWLSTAILWKCLIYCCMANCPMLQKNNNLPTRLMAALCCTINSITFLEASAATHTQWRLWSVWSAHFLPFILMLWIFVMQNIAKFLHIAYLQKYLRLLLGAINTIWVSHLCTHRIT